MRTVPSNPAVRDFLTSRRARITPADAGIQHYGTTRRVAGLRREEVAMLAGISVEYYTRLERGNTNGVSDDVLENICRALQLDEAERRHLFNLARATSPEHLSRRRTPREGVRVSLQQVVDSMSVPAYVVNERLDILAANPLGRGLYSPLYADGGPTPNVARFLFLGQGSDVFFPDRGKIADDAVAILRASAGRSPYDKRLTDLVGELSTRSEEFRVLWASQNVKLHRTGSKRFNHPLVGEITLGFETLEVSADSGQRINVYTAEPGSRSEEALGLIASWVTSASGKQEAGNPR